MNETVDQEKLAQIRAAATRVLSSFVDAHFATMLPQLTLALRPRPGDASRLFVPSVVALVEDASQRLWRRPAAIAAKPEQTLLIVDVSPAAALAENTADPVANRFPGGMRQIANLLLPASIWVSWKYVRPGSTLGTSFTGLAYLDDDGGRFAWYPKPWIMLESMLPDAAN